MGVGGQRSHAHGTGVRRKKKPSSRPKGCHREFSSCEDMVGEEPLPCFLLPKSR